MTIQAARIAGPVSYVAASGRELNLPLGPCLVERTNDALTDIVWGADGQNSTAMPSDAVQAARDRGHLILLD